MSNSFDMTIHPKGVRIYSLSGQLLSIATADQLVEQVELDLNKGKRKFIVNIEGLDHVNSSGLNNLLRTFTKIRNKGGESVILKPSSSVEKLLEISKLNTVFQIEKDEESAIKYLTAHEA